MNIRSSNTSDIPNIIQLLKASLGESLMPKSETYWQWKHIDNPFGTSPVWVAEENGQLIGVRAFMQWQWQKDSKTFRAIRAVDTATDPKHQGKGIFKKLTLGLLEQCKAEGIDMVYNTPNHQSKPGYLKMGWEEVGKLPIQLSIKKPLQIVKAKINKARETRFLTLEDKDKEVKYDLKSCLTEFNFSFAATPCWKTNFNLAYLNWRYAAIPNIPYYGHYNEKAAVIFRLKSGALGVEFRVCDVFGEETAVKNLLSELYYNCEFDYMSINGFSPIKLPGILKKNLPLGPDVTIRTLAQEDLNEFKKFNNWQPGLGDLEVF